MWHVYSSTLRLTHCGRRKRAGILQRRVSNAFLLSGNACIVTTGTLLKSGVPVDNELVLVQVMEQAPNHYLNKWQPSSLTHIFVTGPRWVDAWRLELDHQAHCKVLSASAELITVRFETSFHNVIANVSHLDIFALPQGQNKKWVTTCVTC